MSVCEPAAPSMSHFKVLSLPASWHLLTSTIIMLIYIVWLHKVIYAQLSSMAARRGTLPLLNVLEKDISVIMSVIFLKNASISFHSNLYLIFFLFFALFYTYLLTSLGKSIKVPTRIVRPPPGEKIIATNSNWAVLVCSWGEDELGSLSRRTLFSSTSEMAKKK